MENEKRLIDANKTIGDIRAAMGLGAIVAETLVRFIEKQPTVEATEVVDGYWIESYSADHIGRITEHSIDCSVCDSVFKDDSREVVKHWKEQFKVCPFCGAKMDLSQITEQTTDAIMKMGENAHGEGW